MSVGRKCLKQKKGTRKYVDHAKTEHPFSAAKISPAAELIRAHSPDGDCRKPGWHCAKQAIGERIKKAKFNMLKQRKKNGNGFSAIKTWEAFC